MDGRCVVLLALAVVTVGSYEVERCYDCFTSTANSACHQRPQNEANGRAVCPRGTKSCVIERHETSDGNMISLRRRCATKMESRYSYNRCDSQPDGTARCLSFCKDPICNRGPGKLFRHTRYWNHDSPDYADYVFDPEMAVLDPAYGGEARHSKRIQDEQLALGRGAAGSVVMSVVMLVAGAVVRLAVV